MRVGQFYGAAGKNEPDNYYGTSGVMWNTCYIALSMNILNVSIRLKQNKQKYV